MNAKKPRILVGDSEAWALEIFAQAADRLGAEIRQAKNGVEAIELFKTFVPSVVVVDTLLPKVDGLQVASKIREMELGRIVPIVVTSAIYRRGGDVEQLRARFGFTDFLEKPFQLDDVVALLGEYLDDEGEAPAADADVAEDGEPVRLPSVAENPLGDLGVPALLCQLHRARKTGILTLRQGEITKVLFFERGHVTHARSNSKRDRLGRVLMRSRRIGLGDYDRARTLQIESAGQLQLGSALVQLGVLAEDEVVDAVSSQILNIVFGLFSWSEGTWSFLETTNLPPEYTRFAFNTANLIFWGLRQLEGHQEFARLLPNPKVLVSRAPEGAKIKESLHLTFFEEQILNLVDGRRRLGEILSIGRLTHVDAERVLFSLLVLGVLAISAEGAGREAPVLVAQDAGDIRSVEAKGSLQHTSVARLLSRIHLARVSGRVTFRSSEQEAEVHVDRGEIVYARSSREDLRLGRILLDSAKITQAEYDEATARVLDQTYKKIGAVFLDMRALSLEDLNWALRFQVQSIVLDLFRWRDGEYQFTPEEPRHDLMVTLESSTPNLIMEGVRTAPAPPGIGTMLASPDALLIQLWGEEHVSRTLQLTSAERHVLSAIGTGRLARELRGTGLLGDEDLARFLHGLLALEVVRLAAHPSPSRENDLLLPFATGDSVIPSLGDEDTPLPPGRLDVDSSSPDVELSGEFRIEVPAAARVGAGPTPRHDVVSENHELRMRVEQLTAQVGELRDAIRALLGPEGRDPEVVRAFRDALGIDAGDGPATGAS